jgi:hypothetical protein
MFGIGTAEVILFGIIAAILFSGRLPSAEQRRERPPRQKMGFIELVTEQRDKAMTERWKKFLWSPAFWATIGVFGCVTGLYFQRVANNGSGLWCLGLVFLGAAYLEHKD